MAQTNLKEEEEKRMMQTFEAAKLRFTLVLDKFMEVTELIQKLVVIFKSAFKTQADLEAFVREEVHKSLERRKSSATVAAISINETWASDNVPPLLLSSSFQTTEASTGNTTPAAPATTMPAFLNYSSPVATAAQSSFNRNQHLQQMQQHPLHQHHTYRQMYNPMHSDYTSMGMKNPVAGRAVQPNASSYHMPYAAYQMDTISQRMPPMHALPSAVSGHHQQQQTTQCFNYMQQNYTQNVLSNPNAATVDSSNRNNRENFQTALNQNLQELLTASLNSEENENSIRTLYEDILRVQQPPHLERPPLPPQSQQQQTQSQNIPTTRGQKRKATTFVSSIPQKMEFGQQHRHQEQQRNNNLNFIRNLPVSRTAANNRDNDIIIIEDNKQPQKSSVSDESDTEPPTMVPRFVPNFTIGPQQPPSTESNSTDMTTSNFRL